MAAIHAPVPGRVTGIQVGRLPDGGESSSVVLRLGGSFDRLGKRAEKYLWNSMARKDILSSLRDKGVVEAEEPGRPLHELLASFSSAGCLVLDGVENEPWLRTEAAVLAARPDEVAEGLGILARVLEPSRIICLMDAEAGIDTAPFAEAARTLLPPLEELKVAPRYPRSRKAFIKALLARGRRGTPELPAFVVSPSSALAAFEAVSLAKPFLERYLTVGGGAVLHPAVLKARIGTSIGDLIAECGGLKGRPECIVLGGPFTGTAAADLDVPITKTTKAVLALSAPETRAGREHACIRCGRCADACPVGLDPEHLLRLLEKGRIEEAESFGLPRCILCGACAYACPSRIPLAQCFAAHGARAEEGR
jgi:electron transport complex protein RnfC